MKRTVGWMMGALAVAVAVAPVRAAEAPAALEARLRSGPSVADLVTYAYQTNPKIAAARQKWKSVVERYRVSTAYPDPQVMVTYFPEPIETRLGPQDWNAVLSQMIPFPGKLSKAGEVVEADARIARLELDKTVRDVIVALRESVHELLYIRRAKQVVAANRELLDHMRKVAETAHAGDRATFVDVAKAQSQRAQLEYDALLLEELEATERARLNALLNRAPGAELGPLPEIPFQPLAYSLDEIHELAAKRQEEIRIAEARVAKARAKLDLARYENRPDFKVGLFYAGVGEPDVANEPDDAGRDALGVQFGMTIPLWLGKNAGRTAAARAEIERARALKVARINDTDAAIRSVYFRLKNAERLVTLYRDELLPQAAQSLDVAETWFQEGEGSFSDFVETQSVYYNFQLSLARAEADYGKFLARLERLTATSLTRREASAEEGKQ
ncbi:TolC family protein [Deferrisoma camini]|uniref:TolC family protein n=1 Tax=Deferrisoma camini TaxID=1035120 RepID=UPI0004B0D07A|nr:TolC family protein [Deferrisoma camini]